VADFYFLLLSSLLLTATNSCSFPDGEHILQMTWLWRSRGSEVMRGQEQSAVRGPSEQIFKNNLTLKWFIIKIERNCKWKWNTNLFWRRDRKIFLFWCLPWLLLASCRSRGSCTWRRSCRECCQDDNEDTLPHGDTTKIWNFIWAIFLFSFIVILLDL